MLNDEPKSFMRPEPDPGFLQSSSLSGINGIRDEASKSARRTKGQMLLCTDLLFVFFFNFAR